MKRILIGIILSLLLGFVACHYSPNYGTGPGNLGVTTAPHLIHVYNGQKLGYYTSSGALGFQTVAASVFDLGQNFGVGQQLGQNFISGDFYLGTTTCAGGCNYVIFFNGLTGGPRSGHLDLAKINLSVAGSATGLSVDILLNHLYAADPVHGTVTVLDSTTGIQIRGPLQAPISLGAKYLAADEFNNRVVVTETAQGAAWFLDGSTGAIVPSNPPLLSLTVGGGCATAASVGLVTVNPVSHLAYVLCGNEIVFLSTGGTPTYKFGNLKASTFSVASIATGTDIVFDSISQTVIVSGEHFVSSVDAQTGGARASLDLLTGNCGVTAMDLAALAYSSADNTVFVADTLNGKIYLLDGGTLNFKNGKCTNSSFDTPDVPGPRRLSYF